MSVLNQRGIVSIVSVSLVSVLISVVTVALVSQMTSQVHQSTDDSDRVAAQYAAESGAEDALAFLKGRLADGYYKNHPLPNQTCNTADKIKTLLIGGVPSADPAITCRGVATSGVAQATLQKDQTNQYDLSGATALDGGSLELDWDSVRNPTNTDPRTFSSQGNIGGSQTWDGPPALEVTVAYTPTASPNNPQTKSIYLLPRCKSTLGVDGACELSAPPGPTEESFNYIWQQNDAGVTVEPTSYPVDCYGAQADDYSCKIYLPGGPGASFLPPVTGTSQYVVRIKALASNGDYQLSLFHCGIPSSICAEPLALTNATIDVTAQQGYAYQRVIETPQVRSNPLGTSSYAVLGTDNICKTLQLLNEGGGAYTPQFYADCDAVDSSPNN